MTIKEIGSILSDALKDKQGIQNKQNSTIRDKGVLIKNELGSMFTLDEENKKVNVDFSQIGLENITLKGTELIITRPGGEKITTDLSGLGGVGGVELKGNDLIITKPDGEKITTDLGGLGVDKIELKGSNLVITKPNGETVSVNLSSLIPKVKADQFTKAISYNSTTKEIILTIGNDLNDKTSQIKVSVADLVPVAVGSGIQGDGTANSPVSIKLKPGSNNPLVSDSSGISIDPNKLGDVLDKSTYKPTATVKLESTFGDPIGYAFTAAERKG